MNGNTTFKRVKLTWHVPPAFIVKEKKTLKIYRNHGWKATENRVSGIGKRVVMIYCNGT